MCGLRTNRRGEQLEPGDVIDHVQTATVRRNDEITIPLLQVNVIHGDGGQPSELEPRAPAIHCGPQTKLRAREQHLRIFRIFAHHLHRRFRWQIGGDARECLAAVGGPIDERRVVPLAMRVDRDVRHLHVPCTRRDAADAAALRRRRNRCSEIRPRTTLVIRAPQLALVGAGPKHARLHGRFRKCIHDAEILCSTPHGGHSVVALRREVGRDHMPLLTVIRQLEYAIAGVIHHALVVHARNERRRPVKAKGRLPLGRVRTKILVLPAREIEAKDVALLRLGVHQIRIRRIERAVRAVAASDRQPVRVADSLLAARVARPYPVRVVLQPTADAIRHRVVGIDAKELAAGKSIEVCPPFRAVVALVQPAVRAQKHALRHVRIDRERVVVRMHILEAILTPRLAAIVGHVEHESQHVNALVVLGIHANLAEVERAWIELALTSPGRTGVVAAKHSTGLAVRIVDVGRAAGVTLNEREHRLRILGIDRQPDAASHGRQPGRELGPRRSTIRALEQASNVLPIGRRRAVREHPRPTDARILRRV